MINDIFLVLLILIFSNIHRICCDSTPGSDKSFSAYSFTSIRQATNDSSVYSWLPKKSSIRFLGISFPQGNPPTSLYNNNILCYRGHHLHSRRRWLNLNNNNNNNDRPNDCNVWSAGSGKPYPSDYGEVVGPVFPIRNPQEARQRESMHAVSN